MLTLKDKNGKEKYIIKDDGTVIELKEIKEEKEKDSGTEE